MFRLRTDLLRVRRSNPLRDVASLILHLHYISEIKRKSFSNALLEQNNIYTSQSISYNNGII